MPGISVPVTQQAVPQADIWDIVLSKRLRVFPAFDIDALDLKHPAVIPKHLPTDPNLLKY